MRKQPDSQAVRDRIESDLRALSNDFEAASAEYAWRENTMHWTVNNRSWSLVLVDSSNSDDFANIEARFEWAGTGRDIWDRTGRWVWRVWRGSAARYTDAVYLRYVHTLTLFPANEVTD